MAENIPDPGADYAAKQAKYHAYRRSKRLKCVWPAVLLSLAAGYCTAMSVNLGRHPIVAQHSAVENARNSLETLTKLDPLDAASTERYNRDQTLSALTYKAGQLSQDPIVHDYNRYRLLAAGLGLSALAASVWGRRNMRREWFVEHQLRLEAKIAGYQPIRL